MRYPTHGTALGTGLGCALGTALVTLLLAGCANTPTAGPPASSTAGPPASSTAGPPAGSTAGPPASSTPGQASASGAATQPPGSPTPSESGPAASAAGSPAASGKPASRLRRAGDDVLALLAAGDYRRLAELVHPTQGVRFTPYLTVDVEGDITLTPAQVAGLGTDDAKYTWGADPGTGKPIRTTFAKYARRFLTDQDYARAPVVAENRRTAAGSSLDNTDQAYRDAQYVEYHFPGFDPQYEGMDWETQRLVFTSERGRLYLVGIVHDSWTP